MLASEQEHALSWGALMISEPGHADLADTPYQFWAHGEGQATFGNPVTLSEAVKRTLIDGSSVYVTGYDSRVITLQVAIIADDGENLARGEAALMAEVMAERPARLRWVPPATESAPCNFDVQVANLERGYPENWTRWEAHGLTRFFTLTLTCEPWVSPDEPVVVEALPLTPETEPSWSVVDACSSATNWARETNGSSPAGPTAVTVLGESAVIVSAKIDHPNDYLRAVRTFGSPLAVSADEFLAIDVVVGRIGGFTGVWKIHDGVGYRDPTAVVAGAGEGGSTRLYFADLPASISVLKVLFDWHTVVNLSVPVTHGTADVAVLSIGITDQISLPTSTTRERLRSLDVPGSAPTTASLRVYTDAVDDYLGSTVLVYTAADATTFPPPLRAWLDTSASATVDSTRISGARNDLSAPMTFLVPADLLASGHYQLVVQCKRTTTPTIRNIDWSARVVDSDGDAVFASSEVTSGSTDVTFADTEWHPRALTTLTLPPVALDDGVGFAVEIELSMNADGDEVLVDEAWLLNVSRGSFTLVDLPSTAEVSWMEIRSDEVDALYPTVYVGTGGSDQEQGEDIGGRYVETLGTHTFPPGDLLVFTACSHSTRSQSDGRLFPHFHSHVVVDDDEE